jgi:hypothetical protein
LITNVSHAFECGQLGLERIFDLQRVGCGQTGIPARCAQGAARAPRAARRPRPGISGRAASPPHRPTGRVARTQSARRSPFSAGRSGAAARAVEHAPQQPFSFVAACRNPPHCANTTNPTCLGRPPNAVPKASCQDNRCANWFGRPWFLDLDDAREKETRINKVSPHSERQGILRPRSNSLGNLPKRTHEGDAFGRRFSAGLIFGVSPMKSALSHSWMSLAHQYTLLKRTPVRA